LKTRWRCVSEFREFTDTFDVVEQALGRWLVV